MNEKQRATITINPDVVMQEVEDEIVLLHVRTEHYFSLDDVGTTMWSLIQTHRHAEDILTALLDIYDVSEEELAHDLDNFLKALEARDLISISDE